MSNVTRVHLAWVVGPGLLDTLGPPTSLRCVLLVKARKQEWKLASGPRQFVPGMVLKQCIKKLPVVLRLPMHRVTRLTPTVLFPHALLDSN